jgi:Platelet-activating factor acetylhydrolase, isoform II
MVHIWYPTRRRDIDREQSAPYLPGFDSIKDKLNASDIADMFRPGTYTGPQSLPKTDVVDGAPIAPGKQQYPLLIFSHGWGNPTFLYTAELEDIVSHGYIILAVDHPYDTTYTLFPNGDITLFAQDRFNREVSSQPHGLSAYSKERVTVMAQDNVFALTQILMYESSRRYHAPFYRKIDTQEIGAFGHSIGGLTAARTCQIDHRVKACMDQDSTDYRGSPFVVSDIEQTETQPFLLFVVSSADVWSPKALNPTDADLANEKLSRSEFNAIMKDQQENQTKQMASIAGGSYRIMLFNLPGFTHRTFSDQPLLLSKENAANRSENIHNFRVAEAYTLAFFDKYLKHSHDTILDTNVPIDSRVIVQRFPPHR